MHNAYKMYVIVQFKKIGHRSREIRDWYNSVIINYHYKLIKSYVMVTYRLHE